MSGQKAIREASTKPIYTGYSEGLEKVEVFSIKSRGIFD